MPSMMILQMVRTLMKFEEMMELNLSNNIECTTTVSLQIKNCLYQLCENHANQYMIEYVMYCIKGYTRLLASS